jgi:hypothetical protein
VKLLRASSFVALSLLAVVSACVGSDPDLVAEPGPDGGGPAADTGTKPPPGSEGGAEGGGEGGSCAQGTMCGASCVDTATSADHCGACGHSCGGGKCSASVCQPVVVASNITGPLGVAAAGGSAFWLRNGAVERCPVTGCTGAPTLITSEVAIGAEQPGGTTIVTDGNQVAWIATGNASGNGRDVFNCGVAGCLNGFGPKTSTGLTDAPTQIALEGSTLFSTQNTGAEKMGPISTLVMTGTGIGSDIPSGIAADATNVYVVGVSQSATGVDRCTRAAGGGLCTNPTRLFVGAKYVAAGAGVVVATSTDGIKLCASTGCGGSAKVVMASDKDAAAIAASSAFAVWANPGSTTTGDGTVRACELPACASPRTIATAQDHPIAVTIADGFVYWVNGGVNSGPGSIWRAAL